MGVYIYYVIYFLIIGFTALVKTIERFNQNVWYVLDQAFNHF